MAEQLFLKLLLSSLRRSVILDHGSISDRRSIYIPPSTSPASTESIAILDFLIQERRRNITFALHLQDGLPYPKHACLFRDTSFV